MYLLLAIAFKKNLQIQQGINILDQALLRFKHYYDAYIYRAKLKLKLKMYQTAYSDFEISIILQP